MFNKLVSYITIIEFIPHWVPNLRHTKLDYNLQSTEIRKNGYQAYLNDD